MTCNIEFYKQHLKLHEASFSRIEHTDAMVAIVYEITQPFGAKQILKICPKDQHFFREVYFLQKMQDVVPIPKIIEIVEPVQNNHGAILMEYLPGVLLEKESLTTQLAYELGSTLAKIHKVTVDGYGDLLYPSDLRSNPADHWLEKLDESIEECRDHLSAEIIEQAYVYVKENVHLLETSDEPSVVHRDFRPGNIIIDQGKLSGIIDWGSARASFSQEDFIGLDELEWSNRSEINNAFLKGYSRERKVPEYKQMMPLLLLSRAFATVGYTLKTVTWNTTHTQAYHRNLIIIEETLLTA